MGDDRGVTNATPHGHSRSADPRVVISLLGPLTITVDGVDSPVTGHTQRRLVTALALAGTGGSPVDIGALVDAVYGAARPPRPRRSLATLIWRLRQEWGADAIQSDRYHYWLSPERCVVDVEQFDRALTDVRSARGEKRVAALREAIALWRTDDPAELAIPGQDRVRLDELRLGAVEELAALLHEQGAHGEAADLLRPVVTSHPTWERSAALLISSLGAIGEHAQAQQVLDTVRRALQADGVEPGPDLEAAAHVVFPMVAAQRPAGKATTALDSDDGRAQVGRQREREAVVDALHEALTQRRPTTIVIRGEAGIGKTTLLRAALAEVTGASSARVVALACDRRSTLPYGPLMSVAAAAPSGALTALLRSGPGATHAAIDEPRQVHAALLSDVRTLAEPHGVILAIEDAQFAPAETVRALTALLQHCGPLPVAVVSTTREPESTAPIHDGAADVTVTLRGLDVRGVALMTHDDPSSPHAAHLHRLTGGNPLYVRQLQHLGLRPAGNAASHDSNAMGRTNSAQMLATDLSLPADVGLPADLGLPGDLGAAIDAHLAQVPADTVAALEVAATIGEEFDLITLAAIAGDARRSLTAWRDHLAEAIRHGLVVPDGTEGGFRFVHALIAGHLYARLPAEGKARTHAAIAVALERISLSHPSPADLKAHHYMHGWPEVGTRQVVDAVVDAAHAVGAHLDFVRAADYYRTALGYLAMDPDAGSPQETADLAGAAAGARVAAGDLAGATEMYAAQEKVAADAGLTRSRLFAELGQLRIAFMRRSHPSVADSLADTLAASVHDPAVADDLALVGDAIAAVSVYRPARARHLADAWSVHGPEVGDALRLAIWEHLSVDDQVASMRAWPRATTNAPVTDPAETKPAEPERLGAGLARSQRVAAWLRQWVSEVAVGVRRFDDPPPREFDLGDADDQTVFDLTQWRITCELTAGHLARARILVKEALAGPRHSDPAERARRAASFYGQELFLALVTGDTGTLVKSPIVTSPTWMTRHPVMRYIRAYLVAYSGRDLQARGMVDELIDEIVDGDIPSSDIGPRLVLAAEASRRIGHLHGVRACLPGLVAHQAEQAIFRFGQNWGSVGQTLGASYLALGQVEAAIEAERLALDGLLRVASTVNVPSARRGLAAALEERGRVDDRDEARDLRATADAEDRAMGLLTRVQQAAATA